MKNFWNIFIIITGILALGIFFTIKHLGSTYVEPIVYDSSIDKRELEICNSDRVYQYYNISTSYTGGKKGIKKKLLPLIEKDQISFGEKEGNIAIRFVVSCKGEIGLFRAKGTDKNLKATNFDKSQVDSLIDLISQLKNWKAGVFHDKTYDSYYYINFKIENGRIIDIF